MSQERLIWQGQRQEKLQEAKRLELSISGLRHSIRSELNPHVPISDINQDLVQEQAFEICDKLIRYQALCREIKALNDSLGIR
ncbi:MAG: hypothetical protein KKE62_01915 [Proteobacteria bacterium]|nr:hypothetical protein [Pseudomonadota bacterium]MBU1387105.1 hypothetical protein [Pseudomonadota bacterium]MBU1541578.1 hypothetical protein [Pseudomonadota bacterium]MBU2429524.1 hypothetical protein [Pseudomonadota bacterium]MBU2482535.1 hypothetical protein [Pseudomonadota bacterium]